MTPYKEISEAVKINRKTIMLNLINIKGMCFRKYDSLTKKLRKHGYFIENSVDINERSWNTLIPCGDTPLLKIKNDKEELIVFSKNNLTGEIFDIDLFLSDLKKKSSNRIANNIEYFIQKIYIEESLPGELMNILKEHNVDKYLDAKKYLHGIRLVTWLNIVELLEKNNYFVPIDLVSTLYDPSYFDKSLLMELHRVPFRDIPFQIRYTYNGITSECNVDAFYLDELYDIIDYILFNSKKIRNNETLYLSNIEKRTTLA